MENFLKKAKIHSYGNRLITHHLLEKYWEQLLYKNIKICGWVRHTRMHSSKSFTFLEINDGSTVKYMEITVEKNIKNFEELDFSIIGARIEIKGLLIRSQGKKQPVKFRMSCADLLFKISFFLVKLSNFIYFLFSYVIRNKKMYFIKFEFLEFHLSIF